MLGGRPDRGEPCHVVSLDGAVQLYHDENAGGPAKLILDQLLADGVDITDPAALYPRPSRPRSPSCQATLSLASGCRPDTVRPAAAAEDDAVLLQEPAGTAYRPAELAGDLPDAHPLLIVLTHLLTDGATLLAGESRQ